MTDEITLQAAIDHLNEFVRLVQGLPNEIQWREFAIASWRLRKHWLMLRKLKTEEMSLYEQLDAIKAIAEENKT